MSTTAGKKRSFWNGDKIPASTPKQAYFTKVRATTIPTTTIPTTTIPTAQVDSVGEAPYDIVGNETPAQKEQIRESAFGGFAQEQSLIRLAPGVRSDLDFSQSGMNLYGSFAALNPYIVDEWNGFGRNINSMTYKLGAPGSATMPFQKNFFYINAVPAVTSPLSGRLMNPQFINETQGLCLAINNQAARPLILQQGVSYVFNIDPCLANTINCDTRSMRSVGVYFSTDPVGGGPSNTINRNNGSSDSQPTTLAGVGIPNDGGLPGKLPETKIMWAGTNTLVVPNGSWPFLCYLNSTWAPFQGCPVLVFGSVQTPI